MSDVVVYTVALHQHLIILIVLLKYQSSCDVQIVTDYALFVDVLGYFNYKFNRIFVLFICLLLVYITYFLINFYQFWQKLLLVCVSLVENEDLFNLDLSIFSSDERNSFKWTQKHEFLLFGPEPSKTVIVEYIYSLTSEQSLQLTLVKWQHFFHLRLEEWVIFVNVYLALFVGHEELFNWFWDEGK